MKLFHFKPDTYGEEVFICASNIEEAKEALSRTKISVMALQDDPMPKGKPYTYSNKRYEWLDRQDIRDKNLLIDKMVNCQDGYTIEEYDSLVPVWAEIS